MATGYTANIEKGISFKEYALGCSRAFGALMHLRDEPMSSGIPEQIIPSDYYPKNIKETEQELNKLREMTPEQINEKVNKLYKNRIKEYEDSIKSNIALKEKYNNMLLQVENYKPPSDDHIEFKRFMKSQIKQSMDFDCHGPGEAPTFINAESYRYGIEKDLLESLAHYKERNLEEIKRTNDKNNWIKLMIKSLGE